MTAIHTAGAIVQLKEEPSTNGVHTFTATQLEDALHPSVSKKINLGKSTHELNWSFGPVKVQGSVDMESQTLDARVTVFGLTAGDVSGSLQTGVALNINLFAAKGTITFTLQNHKELWVDLDLEATFDHKKYEKSEKILDL